MKHSEYTRFIIDYPDPCYKTGKANSGPVLDTRGTCRRFPSPNMERKHEKTPGPVADFGLSARGRYSFEGPDGKSEVFEVGKPIEKHVLVSFLQLHLLHTLRSTSLISNVSLTLK